MSKEKQRLLNEIETLPEEFAKQVIDFVEYLKFSQISMEVPDNIKIKSEQDLRDKLLDGIEDTNNGKVCSIDEAFKEIDSILAN